MQKEEFLKLISIDGKIITKRCTEKYLQKVGALDWLISNTPIEFNTISDKIKFLVYGGGYCNTCNTRTNVAASGRGFANYCKDHFNDAKKGKIAHNRKDIDEEQLRQLYVVEQKSLLEISNIVGISNVTLQKRLIEYGIEQRTHSQNQSIHSGTKGQIKPRIIIDRTKLISDYKNKIPVKELAKQHECDGETIRRFLKQEGVDFFHRRSYIEYTIFNMLTNLNVEFQVGKKTLLENYLEIDFFIPKYNLGIEVNGLFTHSWYSGKKDKKYHFNKFNIASSKGIHLFQFWEDDINNKPDIIFSMIRNKIGKNEQTIYARKCNVVTVKQNNADVFYELNHIQGQSAKGLTHVGLEYQGNLISLLSYSLQKDISKIHRFCTIQNCNNVGAFTRLLSKIPGNTVITYSSNDIGTGKLYANNNFQQESLRMHDMWVTDYKSILNRQSFMKSKLSTLLKEFDENKTEIENLIQNGYDIIYKSGTKTWVLRR